MEEAERSIGYYRGPVDAVLVGIEHARIRGALLEVDAVGGDEFDCFVEASTSTSPELRERNRRRREGKWRIGPLVLGGDSAMLIPIDSVAALRELLVGDPSIAVIHLAVIDDVGYLVDAPDVGDNEIWVGDRLPAEAIEALRVALGDELRPDADA